ncbi:MAG TPA: hypothetical protein DDW26_12420 [Rhizobiales bacterium]|nr:hypothetical protein [Hyphomicrobiales bacterium]
MPLSTVEDVDSAVAAAKKAAVGWGTTPPLKRIKHMFRFKELLDRNADEIVRAISKEHGKTHADAHGELAPAGQQSTLPIWMLGELIRPRQRPVTNVVAVFVIVVTLLPILAAYYLTREGEHTGGSSK